VNRLQFRDALPSDLEELLANTRITHDEHAARVPRVFRPGAEAGTVELIRAHFEPGTHNAQYWTRIVVCTIDDVFSGHLLFQFWREPFGDEQHDVCAEIADISIVPSQRGNGLGTKMLERAQIEMKASGATLAQAKVWRGNTASAALFERSGYTVLSQLLELRLSEPLNHSMPAPDETPAAPPAGPTRETYASMTVWALVGLLMWMSR
jgi:ribosomal protein S18 acetylase RimI-like enzyme